MSEEPDRSGDIFGLPSPPDALPGVLDSDRRAVFARKCASTFDLDCLGQAGVVDKNVDRTHAMLGLSA